jgi:hypothetical protein
MAICQNLAGFHASIGCHEHLCLCLFPLVILGQVAGHIDFIHLCRWPLRLLQACGHLDLQNTPVICSLPVAVRLFRVSPCIIVYRWALASLLQKIPLRELQAALHV